MPFQSRKQMRWMFANHPAMAHRWAHHTKDIKHLPEHVEHKQAGALHPNLPILRANECVQLRDFLPEMVAKDAAAALGLAPQRLIAPGDTRFLIPLLGVKGPEMQSKTAENGSPVVSLLSMLDLESKSSGKENPELETVTPYLAKASMLFGARNKGQNRLPHALASHAGNKVAGVSSAPITDLQARMVLPHVGHLKTPTAAALHALQARQAEEAAELAKKTKTDAPPPGFHQTDAAQQALGFMSGATGDQPGSGTSVGPGNSPSIHPITSYSGLGAPGTVNGNAAFGTRNNALAGAAKTGSANSPISSAKVQHARKDASSMEDMSLIALCKRAAVEPLPRWKKEPQIPLDQDMIAQPGVQNLLQSLGMEVQAGQLIAKKIAPCEAGAKPDMDTKLRRLWQRRDPEGLEEGNPYRNEKEAALKPLLSAGLNKGVQIARTAAGIPKTVPFSAKPIRHTVAMLGGQGYKPMRTLGKGVLGLGAYSLGSKAVDTVNNVVQTPQRIAETLGRPAGMSPAEIDGMAGDISRHSVGALVDAFTPGFMRSNDTPAAQMQRELVPKMLWNQTRSSFYKATHDTSGESMLDSARRWLGYRTPLNAGVTEATDRAPAYLSELIGDGREVAPDALRYMQALDHRTPLGQRVTDLTKRVSGRVANSLMGKAGSDEKEAGLHELVTHPAAPFVVQPVIGAAGGLAMNEVMRHILDAYYGRELPQKTIDRERVQAAGMGAGMGLVRAALPHASDSIMKMLDPGPSGTV